MKKNREEIIVALDIGTQKVTALVGLSLPDKPIEIIGVGTAPSKGLKKGVVVDLERTSEAIVQALEAAEEMADVEVGSVFVNITGSQLRGFNSFGSVPIIHENYEITREDTEKAVSVAKAVSIPMVLHVVPQEYNIDGQDGVREPVGMSGVKLEVGVHIVTAPIAAVQNIIKCLSRAHLEYEELVWNALSSSASVLTPEEREMGVVLIDMGAGTSDTSILVDGTLKFSDALPGGGNQVTNDVSIGLRLPFNKAEEIKKRSGSALRSAVNASEEFLVPGVLGRASRNMARRDLASIIEARMEETFLIIKQRIEASGLSERVGSGVVLTGGGAMLKDVEKLAARVFNVPVRTGRVRGVQGVDYILESPAFATAVGLLQYGSENRKTTGVDSGSRKRIFHVAMEWMKRMAPR
jgi:cell division protein FtsA